MTTTACKTLLCAVGGVKALKGMRDSSEHCGKKKGNVTREKHSCQVEYVCPVNSSKRGWVGGLGRGGEGGARREGQNRVCCVFATFRHVWTGKADDLACSA